MNPQERQQRVQHFLSKIAPQGGLESLAQGSSEVEERVESTEAPPKEKDDARRALKKIGRGQSLSPPEHFALEAIILPRERPVVDIVDNSFRRPLSPFEHLFTNKAIRARINAAIPSIGRIELPGHPSLPYGGTGFVVGNRLMMTNRHVAEIFSEGLGMNGLVFRSGLGAGIDFLQELGSGPGKVLKVRAVRLIHPYWDMALLEVDGLDEHRPLKLSTIEIDKLSQREIVVVGYPALDPRNDIAVQTRIFRNAFNVKRLQPGKLTGTGQTESFEHAVDALLHDSSTLGGNSGSAVIDTGTGFVVGLHFGGRYLDTNYAVPTHELARDHRVADLDLNFESKIVLDSVSWDSFWTDLEKVSGRAGAEPSNGQRSTAQTADSGGQASVSAAPSRGAWISEVRIPLEISVRVGAAVATPDGASAGGLQAVVPAESLEKMVEPFREKTYDNRSGYNESFLSVKVPLPTATQANLLAKLEDGSAELKYEHFSIVMNKVRRLALFTASNVDASPGRKRPEPNRDYSRKGLSGLGPNDIEKWFTDPRLPENFQLPDRFFTKDRGSFDKGHIVRREDPAWGRTYQELRRANGDTYHATNCSPQVADFNQSARHGEWGELENFILDQADTEKLSIFAGPVLKDSDPDFNGLDNDGKVVIKIPVKFWKVVIAVKGNRPQAYAFVLEQDLDNVKFETVEFVVSKQWRKRMLSLKDLENSLAGIRFPKALHDNDQFRTTNGESVSAASGFVG
jgi:endonuclease G